MPHPSPAAALQAGAFWNHPGPDWLHLKKARTNMRKFTVAKIPVCWHGPKSVRFRR